MPDVFDTITVTPAIRKDVFDTVDYQPAEEPTTAPVPQPTTKPLPLTTKLAEPIKPLGIVPVPKEMPNFWQKTKQAWDIGGKEADLDFQWRDVKYGRMTKGQAEKSEAEFHQKLQKNPLEARNWLENIYLKTVGIAHPMASGQVKGLTYGTIAAGGAAVLGQAGPQALVPEEVVTMPTAFGIGNVTGALTYWAEQGEGSIYRDAIKTGLSHKTASTVSSIGGPIYGAIEFSQVDKFIPKLGGFAKKTVLSAILGYLKRFGAEVLEEGEQKIVTEGAVNILGKALEGEIALADIPDTAKKMGLSAINEMKEAVGPMALLLLPSGAIDVGRTAITKPAPEVAPAAPPVVADIVITTKPVVDTEKAISETQVEAPPTEPAEAVAEPIVPVAEKVKVARKRKPKFGEVLGLVPALDGTYKPLKWESAWGNWVVKYKAGAPAVKKGWVEGQKNFWTKEEAEKWITDTLKATAIKPPAAEAVTEGKVVIKGWHTKRKGGFAIGLEGQRGPGKYIALDKPFQPEAGEVEKVKIEIDPLKILDPRNLMKGTNVEKSQRDWKRAMDIVNAMSKEQVKKLSVGKFGGAWGALQHVQKQMGYIGEVGEIEPGHPEHGRELVIWQAKPTPAAEKAVVPPAKPPAEALVTEKVPPEKPAGLTRDELSIVSTETARVLRQAQLEGAKVGYKIGDKQARSAMKAKVVQLQAEKKLSKGLRTETRKLIQDAFGKTVPKKFLTLLGKTQSKKDLDTAISAVSEVLEKIDQKQAIKELNSVSKKIRSRIGKTMQEKGIRPEYAKKLNALIDSFTTRKLSQWRIKDIGSLKNYLSNLKEGISNDPSMDEAYRAKLAELLVPEKRISQLNKLSQSSIHLLKADDIRTITTELKRLAHLNDVKNKIYLGRTARRVSEYLKQAVKEQESVKNESRLPKEETLRTSQQPRGTFRKVGGFVAGVDNHDTKTLAFTIEGGREGVVASIFGEGLRYGRRAETNHKKEILKYIRKFLADNNISQADLTKLSPAFATAFRGERGQQARKLFAKETPVYKVKIAGKEIGLTMADMMSVYMHAQSDFNLKAMLNEGVASIFEEKGTLSPEELAVIINHVENNPKALALTKMYAHIAENINRPAINRTSMDLKGIEIADVENYFTVERYTWGKVAGNQEYQINLLELQSFLLERMGSKNPIVIRDFFAVLMANMDGVSEYVGMAKPFRAAHTLLSYKNWAKAVDGKGHEIQRRHLNALIERTEQKPKVKGRMESIFGKVLRGAPRAVLAEPGIMAGQIMSEINYHATDIPSKYLLVTNPVPSQKEVERACEEFPWMWCRRNLGAASIVTRDISKTDAALRAFTGKKAIINLPTQGINYVDTKAITFGRMAVEKWVSDTTSLKGQEFIDEVNKRTHKAVSESQPMFETENRSILTSNPNVLAKAFFLFRSYIDQTLRIMSRASTAYRNGRISKSAMASKFGIVFAGFAAYKMLRILVNALLYRRKKDPYEIARDILLSPMRALTVVGYPAERQISRMLDIGVGRKPKTRYFDIGFENLVTSTINEVWNAAKDYGDAVAYLGTGEVYKSGPNKGRLKSEVLMLRATEKMAYGIGKIVGLPTPSLRRARYGWTEKEQKTSIKPRRKAGKPKKKRATY